MNHSPRQIAADQERALRGRLARVEADVAELTITRERLETELATVNTRRAKLRAEAEVLGVSIQIAHSMTLEGEAA